MTSKLALAVVLALIGAGAANAVPPPPPKPAPDGVVRYSKEALASTPAPDLARRMLDEIAARMVEYRPAQQRFYARPKAAFPGVCAVEAMSPRLVWPGDLAWVDGVAIETHYRFTQTTTVAETTAACEALTDGATYFPASSPQVVMRVLEAWTQAQAAIAGGSPPPGACRHQLEKCAVKAVLPTLPVTAITRVFEVDCPAKTHCYTLHIETGGDFWVVTLKTKTPAEAERSFNWVEDRLVGVDIGP